MTSTPKAESETVTSIHPATTVGTVSLTVASLENQIEFYTKAMGFVLHSREGNQATLGTGERELLHLVEQPNLKKYRGVTGLYHFAVLFPNRRSRYNKIAR